MALGGLRFSVLAKMNKYELTVMAQFYKHYIDNNLSSLSGRRIAAFISSVLSHGAVEESKTFPILIIKHGFVVFIQQ